ncbi:lipopolysaccharide biosynthesis glycosyltransferase [Pseudorhizobium tarimense]|uniref:Lipopolysaccharide biosynthesis glycosyltransferase n=1 Tax=Pseudorhizobium tarimense TaxID=1079109 RepID=A0ABV2H4F1_9HYPH|nr:glycosyltransferase [Pseudorhizobium tarimense]MCJ8518605.1 glycosyl transferase [Pseudorhizobium tarimense]
MERRVGWAIETVLIHLYFMMTSIRVFWLEYQCIFYVTDENYFLPTAVSALQARKAASASTDVVVVLAEDFKHRAEAAGFCKSTGIILRDGAQILADRFAQVDRKDFKARISIAAMGRLLLWDLLPPHYRQLIYMDGDTQIVGDLTPLENVEVPKGRLLAAMDYMSIANAAQTGRPQTYFNSGVLKFDPADWVGAAAFQYFTEHGGHLHDQGALNTVAGDATIFISNRWNFPRQFLHLAKKRPAIIHFASHPKPWDGVYFPCSRRQTTVYHEACKPHPSLAHFVLKITPLRRLKYRLRSIGDRMAYYLPVLGRGTDPEAIRSVVCAGHHDETALSPCSTAQVPV